jgi:hypothetical protein
MALLNINAAAMFRIRYGMDNVDIYVFMLIGAVTSESINYEDALQDWRL